VTTGNRRAEQALVGPMTGIGWASRAAGWFTLPMSPTRLAVAALSVAVAYAAKGEGRATLHIGLRDEDVQRLVAALSGERDHGYRNPTYVTSIGYLMPRRSWHQWPISPETAAVSAAAMAAAVQEHAHPYLERVASDDTLFLQEAMAHAIRGPRATYTLPVIMALQGHVPDGLAYVERRCHQRADARQEHAAPERHAADVVARWLREQ
jgi:hypothetical protein